MASHYARLVTYVWTMFIHGRRRGKVSRAAMHNGLGGHELLPRLECGTSDANPHIHITIVFIHDFVYFWGGTHLRWRCYGWRRMPSSRWIVVTWLSLRNLELHCPEISEQRVEIRLDGLTLLGQIPFKRHIQTYRQQPDRQSHSEIHGTRLP